LDAQTVESVCKQPLDGNRIAYYWIAYYWIAYYSTYNGKPAVLKIRVGTNHQPELVAYASDLNPVRWSPRGDWIAWNDGHKLALASADGKQKRVVSQKQWLTFGWSQDGNHSTGLA